MQITLQPFSINIPWLAHPKQITDARFNETIQVDEDRARIVGVKFARSEQFFLHCFRIEELIAQIFTRLDSIAELPMKDPDTIVGKVCYEGDETNGHTWSGSRADDFHSGIDTDFTLDTKENRLKLEFHRQSIYDQIIWKYEKDDAAQALLDYPNLDTSRGNGFLMLDISDREKPKILASALLRYDQDLSSGLSTNPFAEHPDDPQGTSTGVWLGSDDEGGDMKYGNNFRGAGSGWKDFSDMLEPA